MSENKVLKDLIQCLEKIGVYIDINDKDSIDLSNYIEDSIEFMSFIVEIEEKFSIEIPTELLLFDNFTNLNSICILVEELLKQNNDINI